MAKTDRQPGPVSTRFSKLASARGSALAEEDAFDASGGDEDFYRPAVKKPPTNRPAPGDFPFRDNKQLPEDELDDDAPFLRSRRRVAVRRGLIPRGVWGRIGLGAGAVVLIGGLTWFAMAVRGFAAHDPRFRIDSSENIQILGNSEVTPAEMLSVFGSDMGRNVFFIPLKERRIELERLPWVKTATVMRLLPDQLRIAIVERTPVAFVRTGNEVGLVDHAGVLLSMDPKTLAAKHYSFPVVTGIVETDPQSTRAARMKLYQRFIHDLDSTGEKFSGQLSEVDLSDPEDVKAFVPSDGSELLLHFGDEDFLVRWRNYQQHLAEWKQQYPHLASVDLRYERQVVLEMQKGTPITPGQDAAGKTIDDLKAEASTISPKAARQMAAKSKKTVAKKHLPTRYATRHSQQGRN